MIKKTKINRFLAVLLCLCMILSMLSGLPSFAFAEDTSAGFGPTPDAWIEDGVPAPNANQYTIYLYVDTDDDGKPDTAYGPNDELPELKDGTAVEIVISWELNDGTTEFELGLGDLSSINNFSLDQTYSYSDENGHKYEVSFTRDEATGEVTVHIKYVDVCDCTSRNIQVTFDGTINLDPRDENTDGDNSFKIGDQDIPYTPDYSSSGLDVEKTHGKLTYDTVTGKFYLTYTVTNTIHGRIKDPVLYDDLPDGMTLVVDSKSPTVTFTPGVEDFDGYPGDYPNDKNSWELKEPYIDKDENNHSFGFTFPDGTVLYDGDTVTYTYTVEVSEELVGRLVNYTQTADNTAYADWENGLPEKAVDSIGYKQKPSIAKSGIVNDNGTITWTITYNLQSLLQMLADILDLEPNANGDYGDVLQRLITEFGGRDKAEAFFEKLGLSTTITDTLVGNNHKWEHSDNQFEFSIFDMDYIGTGQYTYTLTTIITDDSVPMWGNDVSLDRNTKVSGTAQPNYGIWKSDGTVTENGTISWTVTVDIPGLNNDDFEYVIVKDVPINGGKYPSGSANEWDPNFNWQQNVLTDTIKINGVPLATLVAAGEVAIIPAEENGAFCIKILSNYRGRAEEGFSKAKITFETEVYNKDNKIDPNGGLVPFYHYENEVYGEWHYGDVVKKDYSYGKIEEDADFDYIKNYVAPSKNDTDYNKFVLTWEIRVTNPQWFYDKNGIGLLDLEKLVMSFTDKLPEGTVYADGSAQVTITDGSSSGYPTWASATNRNNFFKFLGEKMNLIVTVNEGGTISINCNVPENEIETFRESVYNYEFGIDRNNGNKMMTGKDFLELRDLYFTITYDTQIEDSDTFFELWNDGIKNEDGSVTIPFVNTVQGTINDVLGIERTAETSRTYEQSLKKKAVYESDRFNGDYTYSKKPIDQFLDNGGYRNIYFEIVVNADRMDFLEDPNAMLTLVDNMGSDLNIIPYSIQITEIVSSHDAGYKANDPSTHTRILKKDEPGFADEYSFAVDSEQNRITFNVPDGKYLILSYWANVMDDGDNIFEAENNIEIYGFEDVSHNASEAPDGPIIPGSTSSSASTGFSVYKYYIDKDGNEKALEGTKFHLEQLTYHPEDDDKFKLDTSSEKSEWDGVLKTYTDSNGQTKTIPNVFDFTNLPKGAIFRLTETQTPDGYLLADPIYFIFTNYDENKIFTNNTVSSEELLALKDYDIQVFSYYEQIRVENKAVSDTATFKGSKELTGRAWDGKLDEGAYSFKLTALDNAPMPEGAGESVTVTNSMHNISFPSITYTEVGTYTYKISEVSS